MQELLSVFGSYPFECALVTECVLNHTAEGQFQTLDDILQEKTQILPSAKTAWFCDDTVNIRAFVPQSAQPFSRHNVSEIVSGPQGLSFDFSGRHWSVPQVYGVYLASVFVAVIRVARHFGLTDSQIQEAFQSLTVPSGRGNVVYVDPFLIVDSTYNANPQSMTAFFREMASWQTPAVRWAFVGSMNEMGDRAMEEHRRVAQIVFDARDPQGRPAFDIVCFVGPGVDMYQTALSGGDDRCFFCSSTMEAQKLLPDIYQRAGQNRPILVALK
jgi:UDP-N-acetylmuramyl pentapeptide synthase